MNLLVAGQASLERTEVQRKHHDAALGFVTKPAVSSLF